MYKNVIPLIFGTDESYILPTGVTISSILKNASNTTFYDMYILISDDCENKCRELYAPLQEQYKNFDMKFVKMNAQIFDNANVTNPHVRIPTYYRLMSAEILQHYDRCICLDSDLLVYRDLTELFKIELGDNYIAGVKAWDDQQPTEMNRKHMLLLSMDQYIYLGVLVMNLRQIRRDNMTSVFLEHMNKGYRSDDQDVFNVCCYNRISFLPVKYNLLTRFYKIKIPAGVQVYSEAELMEAWENPAIIHFPGRLIKPWLNLRVKGAAEWWKYAEIFSLSAIYKYFYEMSRRWADSLDWTNFIEKLSRDKKIVLFGYSEIGRSVYASLKKTGKYDIIGFCDNDPQKYGGTYQGIPIWGVEQLLGLNESFDVVITSQLYGREIKDQLMRNGVGESSIVEYTNKSKMYYRAIEKQYIETELLQICIKENLIERYSLDEWFFDR